MKESPSSIPVEKHPISVEDSIDQDLEVLNTVESNLEQRAFYKSHPDLLDRIKRTAKYSLGMLVVGFGVSTGDIAQSSGLEPVLRADNEVQKKLLRDEIIKTTGIDLLPIAEAAGFSIEFSVRAKKGDPIILHIGQTHTVFEKELDTKNEDRIVTIQKAIAKVINSIQTVDGSVRAISDESVGKENVLNYTQVQQMIAEVTPHLESPITEDSMQKLQDLYDAVVKKADSKERLDSRALDTINHIFHKRESSINKYLTSQRIQTQQLYVIADHIVLNHRDTDPEQRIFLTGAAQQCFVNSKCDLLPAADWKLTESSNKFEGEAKVSFDKAELKYKELKRKIRFDKKFNAVRKHIPELDELFYSSHDNFIDRANELLGPTVIKPIQELIIDGRSLLEIADTYTLIYRERSAVEQIHERVQNGTEKQKLLPLIYGSAHNFTQAVVELNQKYTGPTKYGLITIKYNQDNLKPLRPNVASRY